MDLGLEGKRAAVSGGSRGLGRAIADALVAEGADVLVAARSTEDLAKLPGMATVVADLSTPEGAAALRAAVLAGGERLDILVCNAGSGRSVPPGQETAAEWRRVLDVNLFTAIHAVEAVRDLMAPGGAVICISSITGQRVLGAPATYSAAKAAVDALVSNLARPFAAQGVRIVGVAPGNLIFEGSIWEKKLAEDKRAVDVMLARDVPQGRLGSPVEIADLVTFLASPRASFITGTVIRADGGQSGIV